MLTLFNNLRQAGRNNGATIAQGEFSALECKEAADCVAELLTQLINAQAECMAWRRGLNHRTNLSKAKVGATYADQSRIAAAIAKFEGK
jgi:hypothetical protein